MVDAFRKLHPYEKAFTRANNSVKSRIDFIQLTKNLAQGLMYCNIVNADRITNSDYTIVIAKVITGIIRKIRNIAYNKRLKNNKQLFILDKATLENWEDYKIKLDAMLKKKLKISEENSMSKLELLNKDEL